MSSLHPQTIHYAVLFFWKIYVETDIAVENMFYVILFYQN